MLQTHIADEQEQTAFGGLLAQCLPARGIIELNGDLGTGKTTMVRGLLRALGHQGAVRSPTYTLLESYDVAGRQIHHLDLYRLSDPEELEYLGLRDLLARDSVLLIEWPQQGAGVLPPADLEIRLYHAHPGRDLSLHAGTPVGKQVVRCLRDRSVGSVIDCGITAVVAVDS